MTEATSTNDSLSDYSQSDHTQQSDLYGDSSIRGKWF